MLILLYIFVPCCYKLQIVCRGKFVGNMLPAEKNWKKISFGGIPNNGSLMPCLATWAHSCFAMVLPMRTMSSPKGVQKQTHSCSCQGCKATNHTRTLLNLPKQWNSPEPSGTFRKLPPEPTPAYTGTLRNLPEIASRTYTLEPSGTFWKLLPEPTPAYTGTLRNLLPEPTPAQPSSGTCSSDPHRHTPELIWAEDPISLRCWGNKNIIRCREDVLLENSESSSKLVVQIQSLQSSQNILV